MVAVTVLSLALSPLWVITGRRLRTLAEGGITSGSELLRLVYGRETEFVAEKLDQASTTTLRGLRQTASWLRRERRRRGDPGAAANDRGPEPPSPPRSKAHRKKRKRRSRA